MGSVITNENTKEKRAYDDDLARPKFAIMNPELTLSLSDYQTESGCTDIMMHTMERYFTNGGNMEITDAIAEGLLRIVMQNARVLHENPQNYEARAEVMWVALKDLLKSCVKRTCTGSISWHCNLLLALFMI